MLFDEAFFQQYLPHTGRVEISFGAGVGDSKDKVGDGSFD